MGNPAGVRKKKREKRRNKFEQRLGGVLAYVPKELREEVIAEIKKAQELHAANAK
ncbi:MAG: hypothetical protein LC104_08655 [Bacteroidales bacterium]|nr:hypothetical protein [Bacteroidales bacterium]